MAGDFCDLVETFEAAPWGTTLPGLTLGAVRDGEVIYSGAFGHAELEDSVPCAADTVYHVGSITKVLTATMLMQLRDAEKLELDAPVVRWVPEIRRVAGGRGITLRQLAAHTSGLPREAPLDYFETLRFPKIGEVLESLREVRLLFQPGEGSEYSNLGYAVLGHALSVAAGQVHPESVVDPHVVQGFSPSSCACDVQRNGLKPWTTSMRSRVSSAAYKEYVRERILAPLGMGDSGFDLTPESGRRMATGYERRLEGGFRRSEARMDLGAFAPAGQLYSTAEDLCRLMRFLLGCGGGDVLAAASLREMQGEVLGWAASSITGMRVLGFNGQTFAWSADMRTVPERVAGIAVSTNVRTDLSPVSEGLLEALLA